MRCWISFRGDWCRYWGKVNLSSREKYSQTIFTLPKINFILQDFFSNFDLIEFCKHQKIITKLGPKFKFCNSNGINSYNFYWIQKFSIFFKEWLFNVLGSSLKEKILEKNTKILPKIIILFSQNKPSFSVVESIQFHGFSNQWGEIHCFNYENLFVLDP